MLDENSNLILMPVRTDSKGYIHVYLHPYGEYQVHRLVGYLFIHNKNVIKNTFINHINEFKKHNNRFTNLEWCDNQKNVNYGTRNKRAGEKLKSNKNNKKSVNNKIIICININTNKIINFNSMTEASKVTNISLTKIFNMCTIEKDTIFKGYKFKYFDDNNEYKQKYAKNKNEPIVQLDYNFNFQKIFICNDDIKDTYKDISCTYIFKSCCSKGQIMHYNSRWMFLEDYNELLKNKNKEIIIPKIEIVLLTERKKFKKLYLNAFDLIDDGYNINSAIKFCKHKNKRCKDRCWMFLSEYLQFKNIESLDQLKPEDISINAMN